MTRTIKRAKKQTRTLGKKMARTRARKMAEQQRLAESLTKTLGRKMQRSIERAVKRSSKTFGIPVAGMPKWALAAIGAVASTGIVFGSIKLARAL